MGEFAKFHGSPWQNCPNFAAYRGLLFVRELSSILLKKLYFLEAGTVPSYANDIQNYRSFFVSKMQFVN